MEDSLYLLFQMFSGDELHIVSKEVIVEIMNAVGYDYAVPGNHEYDYGMETFLDIAENRPGFIRAMWCGDSECEDKLKDVTGGVKSRCIPFEEENVSDTCVCCGKKAKHMVVWGRQY